MNDKQTPTKPNGELVLRTLAMPSKTNQNGDIFGGWILAQMDLGGGIKAKLFTHNRVVTVAIESMIFHNPVAVGDLVDCYAEVTKVGNTSMVIDIETWVTKYKDSSMHLVTEGLFTYVAIDEHGRPTPVGRKLS